MLAEKTFTSDFIDHYTHFEETLGPRTASTFHKKRQEALTTLKDLLFPHIKQEAWKYTNLRALAKESFQLATPSTVSQQPDWLKSPEEANVLVFINGFYKEEWSKVISPKTQLDLLTWEEAEQANYTLLTTHAGKIATTQSDYFNTLNLAYTQQGLVMHVNKNQAVEAPIIIYQIIDTSQPVAVQPRNLVVVGENAQAKLVEIHQTVGPEEGKAFLNEVSEFFVEKNARLSYYKLQHELQPITHINTTQVLQKDHSFFGATTISLEGGLIRNNLNIEIAGEHCESFMTGLSVLSGKTHVDHHTIADHQVPHSYSNELYKGIFDDRSTGVFNGKVFVRPQAQKTNAFQQNRNILLTDTASIYTKPQLEIWADDVKCSHGATTGQLDEDALFYLRTRGIPEERAKALLLTAFAGEVLERIDLAFFKAYCENYIHTRLSN